MIRYISGKTHLRQFMCYFMILIFVNLISGCGTFKVVSKESVSRDLLILEAKKNDSYFIIHETDSVWHLANVHVIENNLYGDRGAVEEWHETYKLQPKGKGNTYDRKDSLQKLVVNEIHLFIDHIIIIDSNRVAVPIDSINLCQIYKAQSKGAILIVLGGFVTVLLVVLIAKAVKYTKEVWDDIP